MIDLRSDTKTRPTPEMREAMLQAEVGDDVYGEDPTVNRLEALAADRLGLEAAVFVPSGTQSNLIALMSHCDRGGEFLVGDGAHTYRYEGGGAAVLGSIQPQPLPMHVDGSIPIELIAKAIKPVDPHFARTQLLCLENTHHGRILPMDFIVEATSLARDHGLATHLDGARLFNAAVATQTAVREIAVHFDSVSVCLSKGLGAPVGTVLCGSKKMIEEARRWKKVTGGGWRQAGFLAAAGIWALEHHVERLADDHRRAQEIAVGLEPIEGIEVESPETNMVWADLPDETMSKLSSFLEQRDILVSGRDRLRLVTHLDVSNEDVQRVVRAFDLFFQGV